MSYKGERYPGEITSSDNQDVEVKVMHKSGIEWKWPTYEDKIFFYKVEDIIMKITLPEAEDSLFLRSLFKFNPLRLRIRLLSIYLH